jgi:hypothetical protein
MKESKQEGIEIKEDKAQNRGTRYKKPQHPENEQRENKYSIKNIK